MGSIIKKRNQELEDQTRILLTIIASTSPYTVKPQGKFQNAETDSLSADEYIIFYKLNTQQADPTARASLRFTNKTGNLARAKIA